MTDPIARLEEIERLMTPGPWGFEFGCLLQHTDAGKGYPFDWYGDGVTILDLDERKIIGAEFDRIALTRNALPHLLRYVRALEEAASGRCECEYQDEIGPGGEPAFRLIGRHCGFCDSDQARAALAAAMEAKGRIE